MTELSTRLVNEFATGITRLFAQGAKGLDPESERHVARRPYERILTGFLTPVQAPDDPMPEEEVADLPADESYEQTSLGFEWCAPLDQIGEESRVRVQVGLNVFVRVFPTFAEAQENARFRQGVWQVAEVWQRVTVAEVDARSVTAEIDLAQLARVGALTLDLSDQVAAAWRRGTPPGVFPGRRPLQLHEPDLVEAGAYEAWVRASVGTVPPQLWWKPFLDVRLFASPTEPGCARVLLRLVNRSEPARPRTAAFWDPRMYAVEVRAEMPTANQRDTEFRVLPNSYRYDRRVPAIGINCQPRAERLGGQLVVRTETVPVCPRPRLVPREIEGGAPRFDALAREDCGLPILHNVLAAMRAYDAGPWRATIADLTDVLERQDAETDRSQFRREIEAFEVGLRLLKDGGVVARSFRLMNETMRRLGLGRRRTFEQWHLFQVVFIVGMLPRLIEGSLEWQQGRGLNLLWFPAGGGKTEAFLGLLIWHAFYDRLRGKALGVTALIRYPLRLLTYQQLQRLSKAMGKAEELRVESRIGGEPLSIGYLVGESTTPNKISNDMHSKLRASGVPASWQRVFTCPICDSRSVRLRYNEDLRLIEHYCGRNECRTRGGRLPIYICDDDLYRYLPTVIVSTVDKLAGLGQNRRFAQLFGRVNMFCRHHGAAFCGSNASMCEASRNLAMGRPAGQCGGADVVVGPFDHIQPSLHIQDELHLLRESLATFDSHYETTAMAMQQALSRAGLRWTLIGSTATIEGYREQARHLYLVDAVRFPSPGPEAYESFYYRADEEVLGRLFVGVLGVGRTHTPAVARTIGMLHAIIERVRRECINDLGGVCARLGVHAADSEQLQQLAFHYEVVLSYVLTRKGGDQVGEAIDSRVRTEIEQLGEAALRVESFNSSVDMPRMIEAMEEIETSTMQTPLSERIRGVIATNIISHGVDIDRFNVMVFAGLPRQFAEYIQASARVGRQLPGISLLVVTPQADRDRSVLDRFDKFHEYVDRLVEPVPINRWSEPALALTLRGIVAAYLMGLVPAVVGRELYLVRHVKDLFGVGELEAVSEAAVVQWVSEAVGAEATDAPATFGDVARRLAARLYGGITGASADHDGDPLNTHLEAMRSLRDIDDPAYIRLSGRDAAELKMMGM